MSIIKPYIGVTTGEKIKNRRIELGMTQKQLGDAVGLSDDRIRHYELNDRNPQNDVLQKIADALAINVGCLAGSCFVNYNHMEETIKDIVKLTDIEFVQEILNKMEK